MTTNTAPAPAGSMTAGCERINAAMNARETRMAMLFYGGPAASPKAKNYLRALLAQSQDAVLVADLRAYFNHLRDEGHHITAADVSAAIRLLRN